MNYEKQEAVGIYENGQTYLPMDWVSENVNSRFYWDEGEEMLVYALPEEILYADGSSVGSGGQPLILEKEDGVYVSMGLVLNYTKVRIQPSTGPMRNECLLRIPLKTSLWPMCAERCRSGRKRM